MEKVTYIIPIHKFDETIEKLFTNAAKSLEKIRTKQDKVILVGPSDCIKLAESYVKGAELVENDNTDFFVQINTAVFQCATPYFSILEIDDEYMPYWNEVAQEYGVNGASVLIPINEFYRDGEFVGLGNEIAWSSSFANTEEGKKGLGYLDIDCLNTYMDFNVTGALIKTEDFISIGGLKPSLKNAAWYEFLLRAAYNSKDIFVVPKIGYFHTIGREDSYMVEISKKVSAEEGKWLINTARQEYFFKNDREKIFTNENN